MTCSYAFSCFDVDDSVLFRFLADVDVGGYPRVGVSCWSPMRLWFSMWNFSRQLTAFLLPQQLGSGTLAHRLRRQPLLGWLLYG